MEEAEITYWYPEAWNEEFRRTGVVKCWLDDSPQGLMPYLFQAMLKD